MWFYTYYYFDKEWNWSTPKHDELKKGSPTDPAQTQDEDESSSRDTNVVSESAFEINQGDINIDTKKPNSYQEDEKKDSPGNPFVGCDFIGGDYDEWAAAIDKPFTSTGGCELS